MSPTSATNEMRHPVTVAMYTALCAQNIDNAWRFRQTYREPSSNDDADHLDAALDYWLDQFSQVPYCDTRDTRYTLNGCRDVSDFARLFATHVVRQVVELNLPFCSSPTPKFHRGRPF